MEEEKAAAYYEELTRKGEGAARFKQGLGFSLNSSETTTNPSRGSALASSSSFLSSFVRASSPGKVSEIEKQAQLENIQNKLKKKQSSGKDLQSRVFRVSERNNSSTRRRSRSKDKYDSNRRHRSMSRERDQRSRGRSERSRRSRSKSYSDDERRHRGRSERSRRSRSRSYSDEERRHRGRSERSKRSRSFSDEERSHRGMRERSRRSRSRSYSDSERRHRNVRHGKGRRSRSSSPQDRRPEKKSGGDRYSDKSKSEGRGHKERTSSMDYLNLIKGYEEMTPAERVKAKMKLQLSQTAEKDNLKGTGAGWERFEFNKDAPLDDEEIEEAEDDAVVVKNIGQSFRFSAVQAKREEQIKATHDEAMFGAPTAHTSVLRDREPPAMEDNDKQNSDKEEPNGSDISINLISDKVLVKQQGSWRDRARKLQNG